MAHSRPTLESAAAGARPDRFSPTWASVTGRTMLVAGLVLTVNGPGSMIGFDYARSFNPADRIGGATGIVNVGGFVASLLLMEGVGIVLDLLTPGHGSDYSLDAFKWAMCLQYVLWVVGITAILVSRRKVIRREQIEVPPIREALTREYRAYRRRRGAGD